ncbi:MAG: T9SS type A sorting domain-containing protein [Flavobacteriaceae bacterium]
MTDEVTIDVESFNNGVYFLKINDNQTQKVIIKK